ncbi:MAG: hypothetical protein ACRD6W_08695 [Nitrososphaerales archaeon]
MSAKKPVAKPPVQVVKRPSFQAISLTDLPPPGPIDSANGWKRIDALLQKNVQGQNTIIEALSNLTEALQVNQPLSQVPGAPRLPQVAIGLPGQPGLAFPAVQVVSLLAPPLSNGSAVVGIQSYPTVTTIDPINANRVIFFLVNIGPNTMYWSFTSNVQSFTPQSGTGPQYNMGIPFAAPSGSFPRGDFFVFTGYTGPIYATCDPGKTTNIIKMDVVTQVR